MSTAARHLKLTLRREAATGWRPALVSLGFFWAALLLLLLARDAGAMASIWWNSSTFNHCLFVLPIIAWLVALRVPGLERLTPRAWAPGLALVSLGAFAWLLGEAGTFSLARHLGLVLMLQGSAVALLGPAVARALLFPLAYMLFLVPFGEEFVPPLQTVTAELAMALLGLAGIPAHISGVFITTPSGWFEVAEACSGVKFLVAMIAYGALVANLCFLSWTRRALFMVAALIVPVIANGVRAFGTIWFASKSSADAAGGFDHIVYGWIFFALVIAATMAAGWRFFDRPVGTPWFDAEKLATTRFKVAPLGRTTLAVLLIAAAPLAWSARVATSATPLPEATLPEIPGWQKLPASTDWQPQFAGADRLLSNHYRSAEGDEADLVIAVYARQGEERKLVGFGQGSADGWAWSHDLASPPGGQAVRIAAKGGNEREVVSFYRIGDLLTGSPAAVKLATLKAKLLGGDQRAVAVIISTREQPGHLAQHATERLLRALGPVEALADRASGRE